MESKIKILVFAISWLLSVGHGYAQDTVVVLGLTSHEGDDAFAHKVTEAFRDAAVDFSHWDVSSRKVSLQQMALAHVCEPSDKSCLRKIGRSLKADLLVYGTISRANDGFKQQYRLALFSFSVSQGDVLRSTSEAVDYDIDAEGLKKVSERFVLQLSDQGTLGAVLVILNPPVAGASVSVAGKALRSEDNQHFRADAVDAGLRTLLVSAPGYAEIQRDITVKPNEIAELTLDLVAASKSAEVDWMPIAGWSAIGLGVVSLGMTAFSWLKINSIQNDSDYKDFQDHPANVGADNICNNAKDSPELFPDLDATRISGLCDEASTWEALQYVFLGFGIVSVGAGVTLLVLDGHQGKGSSSPTAVGRDKAVETSLRLTPVLSKRKAQLVATLRY